MSRAIRRQLPAQQHKVMVLVQSYVEQHGVVPTNRFLQSALGLKSHGSIHDLLRGLERRGIIIRRPAALASPPKNQNTTRRIDVRPRHSVSNVDIHIAPQQLPAETLQVIR